jgi:hypothetical protein
MSPRWEWVLLWFIVAACGALLIAYNLGLYTGRVEEPLGVIVGLVLLGFGALGLRSEYRAG